MKKPIQKTSKKSAAKARPQHTADPTPMPVGLDVRLVLRIAEALAAGNLGETIHSFAALVEEPAVRAACRGQGLYAMPRPNA